MIRFGAIALSVAALVGCASNSPDASSDSKAATSTPTVTIGGQLGGTIFFRKQDVIDAFKYDPTAPAVNADETYLSDEFNRFTTPGDGRRFEWMYLSEHNAWIFADRDENPNTANMLDPYLIDVISKKDTSPLAAKLEAPIDGWFGEWTNY